MKRIHDGMTFEQRRFLQFWIEANGWEHWYVDLNGEMPMPDYHLALLPRVVEVRMVEERLHGDQG